MDDFLKKLMPQFLNINCVDNDVAFDFERLDLLKNKVSWRWPNLAEIASVYSTLASPTSQHLCDPGEVTS